MSNEQVIVRRRRVLPKAPFTVEEIEYTITAERLKGRTLRQTVSSLDNLAKQMLDERLPLTLQTSTLKTATTPPEKTNASPSVSASKNPYDALPWIQSKKTPELSTILLPETPTGHMKELYEKIMATKNGILWVYGKKYKVSSTDGKKYLQCWLK
jgi:hypothetical protein